MRFFIFTARDREVLQAELDGTLDPESVKDNMLLSVLKNRIPKNRDAILRDINLMEKIVEKLNLLPSEET